MTAQGKLYLRAEKMYAKKGNLVPLPPFFSFY